MSNFSSFQPGTKSARSVDCTRPVHDGGRMNENKENRGTDKTLKEELFSTWACLFLIPRERESRPGSERSLLLSVQWIPTRHCTLIIMFARPRKTKSLFLPPLQIREFISFTISQCRISFRFVNINDLHFNKKRNKYQWDAKKKIWRNCRYTSAKERKNSWNVTHLNGNVVTSTKNWLDDDEVTVLDDRQGVGGAKSVSHAPPMSLWTPRPRYSIPLQRAPFRAHTFSPRTTDHSQSSPIFYSLLFFFFYFLWIFSSLLYNFLFLRFTRSPFLILFFFSKKFYHFLLWSSVDDLINRHSRELIDYTESKHWSSGIEETHNMKQ